MRRTELFSALNRFRTFFFLLFAGIVATRFHLWVFPLVVGRFLRLKAPFSAEEAPPDAYCGAVCSLCTSYQKGHCPSCAFGDGKVRASCALFVCAERKGTVCTECPEVLHCQVMRTHAHSCPFAVPAVMKDTLLQGRGYLVKECALEKSLDLFTDRLARGDFGLIVLRESPARLRDWPFQEKVPRVYLRQTVTQDSSLDPTNLAKLHVTIQQFFEAAPRATVLLEGLEYLIAHNGIERILKFIHSIVEIVHYHSSYFITMVDPRVLEDEEMTLLERELVLVGP